MCGIAGVILKSGHVVSQDFLRKMGLAMAHRGPDGEGFHLHKNVGLVHRRLSIIDLEGGAQPIASQDSKSHIVGNGEIYNYLDLQQEIKSTGRSLVTHSDTEVALHMYNLHGTDFAHYLHGMYSIAIHDEERDEVILSRDRFGIKPLYISQTEAGIAFASEPAVLTKCGWVKADVEIKALPSFLNRQYTGGDLTLFKGIYRVKPGETIVIKNGEITFRARHLPKLSRAEKRLDEKKALEQFNLLFNRSVHEHLQSDVPYGAFLSGGIDSASVVAKMGELVEAPRTYTVGFEDSSVVDERSTAERIATYLKTSHKSISFDEKDFWGYLPQMAQSMDDLVADYAALPLLKLSEFASKDVKVILSGEGGDEIFAGYGRYRITWLQKILGKKFRGKGQAEEFAYLFKDKSMVEHNGNLTDQIPLKGFTKIQKYQATDIADWLPDDLLLKVDRCMMRYGLEGRVPFLADSLTSFGFSLPDNLKIKGKKGKWLVKTWLAKRLEFMDVWGKKHGFTVPVASWLNAKRDVLKTYLTNHKGLDELINIDELAQLLSYELSKKQAKFVFTLLCYALWWDVHIAGESIDSLSIKLH